MMRMRFVGTAALLLLGGCALGTSRAKPADPAQEEILSASLRTLRAGLAGEVVIDPRIAAYDVRPGMSWVGNWPYAQAEAFAATLGGRVAEIEDVRQCAAPWLGQTPDQQRCTMRGADVHLALSRPVVRGDEAAVIAVANADYTSTPIRESTRVIRLELTRQSGAWAVRTSRVIAAM